MVVGYTGLSRVCDLEKCDEVGIRGRGLRIGELQLLKEKLRLQTSIRIIDYGLQAMKNW